MKNIELEDYVLKLILVQFFIASGLFCSFVIGCVIKFHSVILICESHFHLPYETMNGCDTFDTSQLVLLFYCDWRRGISFSKAK